MNKLLLAMLSILVIGSMIYFDNGASRVEFCSATGTIKRISQSDARKLLKLVNLVKKINNDWVRKCSMRFY